MIGGLIAGTLDITYACVFSYIRSERTPMFVFRSVAGGALGPEQARAGGIKTAILGLAFHFLIALIWATVYFLASRVIPLMVDHAIVSGLAYGLCVFFFMYGVVLRFSAIHLTIWPWNLPRSVFIGGMLIHMFGIGLPIALVARRYSK